MYRHSRTIEAPCASASSEQVLPLDSSCPHRADDDVNAFIEEPTLSNYTAENCISSNEINSWRKIYIFFFI